MPVATMEREVATEFVIEVPVPGLEECARAAECRGRLVLPV
jgi:hypothetical protein